MTDAEKHYFDSLKEKGEQKKEPWEVEADEEIAEIIHRERKRKKIERFFNGYCFG